MRISDWSSDVCSSDLYGNPCRPSAHSPTPRRTPALPERYVGAQALFSGFTNSKDAVSRIPAIRQPRGISSDIPQMPPNPAHKRGPMVADRKSVVSGKSVSVRVDLGGGGIIKKNKQDHI